MTKYVTIPTVDQFKKDSSILLAMRNSDPILVRLDELLMHYRNAADDGVRKLSLFDLFLTANFWVDQYTKKRQAYRKERYPAVMALFEAVVKELGQMLGESTPQGVANKMREFFGSALGVHGLQADSSPRLNYRPFAKDELVQGRIWFRNGNATKVNWNSSGNIIRATPVESADYYQQVQRQGAGIQLKGYGGFVMTMNREIFMLKHELHQDGGSSTFHSSYTDGSPVAMAGTMLIVKGKILAVRTDSGHYQPGHHNLAGFLMALKMYHVDLSTIILREYSGVAIDTAEFFLAMNTDWDRFSLSIASAKANRGTTYANAASVLQQKQLYLEAQEQKRQQRVEAWMRRHKLVESVGTSNQPEESQYQFA